MTEAVAAFIQCIVPALIGALIGYRSAIRKIPPADRPHNWLTIFVIAGLGGAGITVVVELALLAAFPDANVSSMGGSVAVVAGIGVALPLTRKVLKKATRSS